MTAQRGLTCALFAGMLAGCIGEPIDKDPPVQSGHVVGQSYVDATDDDGFLMVPVDIGSNQTAFQVSAARQSSNRYVYIERVLAPNGDILLDGADWWTSDESLNYGFFGDSVAVLNWPIRASDPGLTPGQYKVWMSVTNDSFNYLANEPVDVSVVTKQDPDFQTGTVHVRIVWADGVGDDPAIKEGVEAAVDEWRAIWANVGLTLGEVYQDSTLDPDMAWARDDQDPTVVEELADKELGELVLVVGDTVNNDLYTYGISAGIPGTLATTARSHVIVSTVAHAGIDGVLDAEDIAVMGETMAHEVGHYMGLFHVVEGGYGNFDAIEDTPRCRNQSNCESNLGNNNMYPYSLCSNQGCERQRQMTAGQVAVTNRYLATD